MAEALQAAVRADHSVRRVFWLGFEPLRVER
jgi:hypothetical protein